MSVILTDDEVQALCGGLKQPARQPKLRPIVIDPRNPSQRPEVQAKMREARQARAAAEPAADREARQAWQREQRAILVRYHANKRRADTLQRTPAWANEAAIRAVYDEAARLTRETGVIHHVDHTIPLKGELVSGLHVETNLRAIPAGDNLRKHNKFEPC